MNRGFTHRGPGRFIVDIITHTPLFRMVLLLK